MISQIMHYKHKESTSTVHTKFLSKHIKRYIFCNKPNSRVETK